MVKAAPAASFVVAQSQLLLEFLIVAFDDPAMFGHLHQRLQRGLRRQGGQPVFGGLRFFLRPFDQEPFFRMWFGALVIAMGRAHADRGESRAQSFLAALAPADLLPGRSRQRRGPTASPKWAGDPHCAAGVWGAHPRPGFRGGAGKGCCPGSQTVVVDSMPTTYCNPSSVMAVAERRAVPIAGIRQHHSRRNLLFHRLPDLLQSNLRLGLKLNLFRNPSLLAALGILAPHFRQVQPPRNRQTRIPGAHRQTHRRLAVIRVCPI